MLDKERLLSKIDALEGYIREIKNIVPDNYDDYISSIEKRRACERLLQISVECVIDMCGLLVSGLRLGLPAEETDLIERLRNHGTISQETFEIVKAMKGFRNILVHDYAGTDNVIVYEMAKKRLNDFDKFIEQARAALR
jgi:uncharacterized protein YutE (UPF0331/DUF86 family)